MLLDVCQRFYRTQVLLESLSLSLQANSPRYSPPPTPMRAVLIHGSVIVLWVVLFAMTFRSSGALAWSTGIAYVAYDTLLLGFVFWQTLRLVSFKTPFDAAAGPPQRATLGVIVAAHNESAVLPITLSALLGQSDAPDQILIADDGSADDTADVLLSLYGLSLPALGCVSPASEVYPSLRWLRLPHAGKASALNKAMACISTDVVLTVDADTLLEPRAIGAVREAFSCEPNLVAATGVLAPVCNASFGGRIFQWFQTYEYIRNFLSRYAWMQVGGLLLISGAFAGFRRQALLEVGGFDPDCLVEDYELIHRMRRFSMLNRRDWTTRVLGNACARTEAPGNTGAFLRQRRRWFGGFLQTQYWYRDMVGDRRYGWLGLAMLPVKAIDTLQPLYGLTAFFLLIFYIVHGSLAVLTPVAVVIGSKILLDLAFHLWSVHLYRRWVQTNHGAAHEAPRASFGLALLAALIEPFTFQILRHTGAAWGWLYFLTGSQSWGRQSRGGLKSPL
jgi:cellulose synthase/poly-beta-1,6-N-acetylglucosamine synthase-like glycosyltransferase